MSAGPTPNLAGGLTADGSSFPQTFWDSYDPNSTGSDCSKPGSACSGGQAPGGNGGGAGGLGGGGGNGGGASFGGSAVFWPGLGALSLYAAGGPSVMYPDQASPLTSSGAGVSSGCASCQSKNGQTPAPIPASGAYYNYVCVADGYLLPNLPITCVNTGETQQSACSVLTMYLSGPLEYGGLATYTTSGGVASLCGTMYPPETWIAASASTGGTGVTVTINTHT